MRTESIAIGTELLDTERIDTNSVWMAQRLARLGLSLHRKSCVGDSWEDLKALFSEALGRSDVLLVTGGLGPTFDDVTKEVLAELLGVPLREDAGARADLLAFYARRNRAPSENNFKQVQVPEGAEVLPNPLGTAPGIWWQDPPRFPGRLVVLLPGVPREMQGLWLNQVEPRLASRAGNPVHTLRLVVGGVPESTLDERTAELRERHRDLAWTILASFGQVELLARGPDPAALVSAEAEARDLLGADLAAVGDLNLEDAVVRHLEDRGETLAIAESMSGGRLGALLTAVPGASRVLRGGVLVYTPEAKSRLLGLDPAFLAREGTVGEAVTQAMAASVRERLGTTWGLAITGHAGPELDPGAPTVVGDTVLALDGPGVREVRRFTMGGARQDIQQRSALWAMDLLRRQLGDGMGRMTNG